MMNDIDRLLKYVQRTNPYMTRERLLEELKKCRYSTFALVILSGNVGFQKNCDILFNLRK